MGAHADYANHPLWLLALMFFAGMLVARELGRLARRHYGGRNDKAQDDDAFAMTSVLGLLALLIGFTFSIALSRYESRRELVVHEANAIGTTWLRTQLLDPGDRERMEGLLRRYVDARIAYGAAGSPKEELERHALTTALQDELWTSLMAVIAPFHDTPRAALLVTTTNEAIDLAAERFATRQAHIPARIMRMLVLFALLSAGLVGYERGHQRKTTTLLFALLTLAATLVVDLDRPSTGLVNVPQEPMLELRTSIEP
jgi:hypothetical protein